jgi:hypothetical protein
MGMPHDDDGKHDEVRQKKRKFEWLNDTSVLAISLLCFAAALLVFCLMISRWQGIGSATAKMLSAEPIEVPQQHREGDNSDNRNYGDEKDREKKDHGQWKLIVSYEDTAWATTIVLAVIAAPQRKWVPVSSLSSCRHSLTIRRAISSREEETGSL